MKKIALLLALLAAWIGSSATIINIKGAPANTKLYVQRNVIGLLHTPNQGVLKSIELVTDANGNATISTNDSVPVGYMLILEPFENTNMPTLYLSPGQQIDVTYTPGSAFPTFSGAQPAAEIADLDAQVQHLINEFKELDRNQDLSNNQKQAAYAEMMNRTKKICENNLSNPGIVLLLTKIHPQFASEIFDQIAPEAYSGIMSPIYAILKSKVEAYRAKQAAKENIAVGKPAPDFTLPDLQGKEISLSSLRGKYVIIDFWGSWCGWCIKGFPALKQTYDELKDYIEVLGIDCGDTEAKWRDAVAKYELPWINVRETKEMPVQPAQVYAIEGFPTKFIISPEGTILDITVGEDPEFFTRLKTILGTALSIKN